MKKLMLWVALFSVSSLFAQTPVAMPPSKESKQKMEVAKVKTSQPAKAEKAKPAIATSSMNSAPSMKKDGTPDKRFKANKHVKKDGTPDMRYKEHKDAPKSSGEKK